MTTNVSEIELKQNINDFFLCTNGIILILMQCGFACLEAGAVRSKNTTNILMNNIMDVFFSCVSYWLVGYALAYGKGNPVIGWTYWASKDLPPEKFSHWFFQFCFAATAATIVSGAVAERCNFITYIAYSIIISGIVYPIVTHWTWTEEGWLKKLGYVDFSGCGPIHLLGGVCSFFGALFVGPRLGRFEKFGEEKEEFAGHSMPLMGIGGLLLLVGFLSFNGGSTGSITEPGEGTIVAKIIINTIVGGSGGSLVILFAAKIGLIGTKTWNFSHTLNAALTGMVSLCAGIDRMEFWACFVSGATGGIIYMLLHYTMVWMLIDDPLDAVAVHFGGGFWGLITASFLAEGGIFYSASKESGLILGYRMIGAGAITVWASVTSAIMFGILKLCGKLRVSEAQEIEGMDVAMHNEPGYNPLGWKTFYRYIMPTGNSSSSERWRHNQRPRTNKTMVEGIMNPAFSRVEEFVEIKL